MAVVRCDRLLGTFIMNDQETIKFLKRENEKLNLKIKEADELISNVWKKVTEMPFTDYSVKDHAQLRTDLVTASAILA